MGNSTGHIVIHSAKVDQVGTGEQFVEFVKSRSRVEKQGSYYSLSGYRYGYSTSNLEHFWHQNREPLIPFFANLISTEARITSSNPAASVSLLSTSPSHPIHILQLNDEIEAKISSIFRRAFGTDLIVHRGGGGEVPLFVGNKPEPGPGEDRVSLTYLRRLQDVAKPLQMQGDGMRSFATIALHVLANDNPSVVLIDEPEAFLHPPQARLIGELIARERDPSCQMFIATHSADILQGLLNGSDRKLRIVRIHRNGDINYVHELSRERTAEISRDPLIKYTSAFQGIFHRHVFICESDADCMFYSALLDLDQIRGETYPDALFTHAGGKHRISRVATALRALGVPVSAIVDIDILNEEDAMRGLFEALGGDWSKISSIFRAVKSAIEQRKSWSDAGSIATEIAAEIASADPKLELPREKRKRIEQVLRKASPWEAIKQAGRSAVPSGLPTSQYDQLLLECSSVGLWIVPVGEMEGFCRSEGNHGPTWVQKILTSRNLATDMELADARSFIGKIWQRAKDV